jgi:hypothetical protein
MNYFSPQFEDKNILINGFSKLWFINRPFHIARIYKINMNKLKTNGLTEDDIFNLIKKHLILKFDNNNFLTTNAYPYSKPNNCNQYVYWTKNNKTHIDVLNDLIYFNYIDESTNYIIWKNSPKSRSIKTISHYHIIIQQQQQPQQHQPQQHKQPKQNIYYNLPSDYLKKIIIIARHGPREPILHLPKLVPFGKDKKHNLLIDQSNSSNSNNLLNDRIINAQLTEHGIKYCRNFGKYIKKIFYPYFDFDQNKTYIGSSNMDRTIDSAIYFYQGLYGQTIDKKSCKKLIELMENIILIDDEKEYDEVHTNINKLIKKCFGYEIKNFKDYFNVLSTIKVYQEHNISLPNEWTNENNLLLEEITTEYFYKLFSTKIKYDFTKIFKLLEKLIIDDNITFAYLSTHDVIIYPLALNFSNNIIELPGFCSSIRIEIWNNDARIYYDDNLLKHIE